MSIQSASPSDFEDVRDLLDDQERPSGDLTPSDMPRFLICQTEEPISDRQAVLRTVALLPRHRLRSGNGEICGTVGFEIDGSVALVRSLAIAPEQRGEGTGTRLLERVERESRTAGAEQLYLWTTNVEFFKRHGYEEVDLEAVPPPVAQSAVADRCPSSAVIMKKQVDLGAYRPPRSPAEAGRSRARSLMYARLLEGQCRPERMD